MSGTNDNSTLPSLDELKREFEKCSNEADYQKFQKKIESIHALIDEQKETKTIMPGSKYKGDFQVPSLSELRKEFEQCRDPAAYEKFQKRITDIYALIDGNTKRAGNHTSAITERRKRRERMNLTQTGPFVKIAPAPSKDLDKKSDTLTKPKPKDSKVSKNKNSAQTSKK